MIIFELHDQGLHVFALAAPLGDAFLGIGIKILLLLVHEGFGSQAALKFGKILFLGLLVLSSHLVFEVIIYFQLSLFGFFFLLGFSYLEFLVSELPELGKLLGFPFFGRLDLPLAMQLVFAAHVYLLFHMGLFLLFEKHLLLSLVLRFGDLLV